MMNYEKIHDYHLVSVLYQLWPKSNSKVNQKLYNIGKLFLRKACVDELTDQTSDNIEMIQMMQ